MKTLGSRAPEPISERTNMEFIRRYSLTTWIIFGLCLGLVTGLFLGEHAAPLQPFGNGFIRLLQMSVLPYITVSLIAGFGRLSYDEAKTLGIRAGAMLLLIWGIGFVVILSLPLTFPEWTSASFFSSSVLEEPEKVDFVALYIPNNPFHALSTPVIPGVVVFSIAVGIALIGIKEKSGLLSDLTILAQALIRVTQFVVRLSPIGVFAIAASAAGTMTLEEFERLQVYFVTYIVGTALLTLWLLPMLVATLTPFTYREIFRASRDALVTGFTTGNVFIILPLLADNIKQLFQNKSENPEHAGSMVDVVIPVSFNFPNVGVLLLLIFVLFAAWYTGSPISVAEYPMFAVLGVFSFFGSVDIGLPFLLERMRLPADMFQLYVVTGVLMGRFATLIAAMHLVALAILATSAVTGAMVINTRKVLVFTGTSFGILVAALIGTAILFHFTVTQSYTKDEVLKAMRWIEDPLPSIVHREVPEGYGVELPGPEESSLDMIRKRGVLRVGYDPESLPFAFFNINDELVGFDVEMAQTLAKELNVKLEFVPFELKTLAQQLRDGEFDIAMSGLIATTTLAEQVGFTKAYLDVHLGIVVEDHEKRNLDTLEEIEARPSLRIATRQAKYYGPRIESYLPQAKVIPIRSNREFFEGEAMDFDFLFDSVEVGSAWTLLFPNFQAIVPRPLRASAPLAYAIYGGDERWLNFLNTWISLQRKDGNVETLYDHWVLGKTAVEKQPRWSVIRNVLGWVD